MASGEETWESQYFLAIAVFGLQSAAVWVGVAYFSCHSSAAELPGGVCAAQPQDGASLAGYGTSDVAKLEGAGVVSRPASRTVYLDAIKVFLTLSVVTYHIALQFINSAWGGPTFIACDGQKLTACNEGKYFSTDLFLGSFIDLNTAYFMQLFFFISGYFVPTSCERKGIAIFLADKFRRLGIPYLFFIHILGPVWRALQRVTVGSWTGSWGYIFWPIAGPQWFVGWLLTFCVLYTAFDDRQAPLVLPCPRLWTLLCIGLAIGFLQPTAAAAAMQHSGNGWALSFGFMPNAVKALPTYVLFFVGGVLARRGGWLEALTSLPRCTTRNLQLLALALVVLYLLASGRAAPGLLRSDFQAAALLGMFCIVFSLVVVEFFHAHFNYRGRLSAFLADAAYTTYLIHPLLISLSQWMYVAALRVGGVPVAAVVNTKVPAPLQISNAAFIIDGGVGYLWAGVLFEMLLVHVSVWPLAYFIKRAFDSESLPRLNGIL